MKHLRTLGAGLLAALALPATAAYIRVTFDNPIFNGVPAPAYDVVTITYPDRSGTGSRSVTTAAGRFQGTGSNVRGVDPSIFVDNLADLYMYCYDVYEMVGSGWSVDYAINFDGETARTLDFLGAVNAVLGGGDPFAWLRPTSGAMAAAIQLGIWESKYETGPWSLDSGRFFATGIDAATRTQLNRFMAAVDGSASLDGRYVITFEAAGYQDVITGDPPPGGVPLPATLALSALGLGLLASRRRG